MEAVQRRKEEIFRKRQQELQQKLQRKEERRRMLSEKKWAEERVSISPVKVHVMWTTEGTEVDQDN